MAKIPPFCDYTREVENLLRQGRRREAVAKTVEYLRKGVATPLFLEFVASLLQPAPRGKGRPSIEPPHWLEIGQEFEELRQNGITHEAATVSLAGKYNKSTSAVEKTVRVYRDAVEAGRAAWPDDLP